jgi:hypothetical protein
MLKSTRTGRGRAGSSLAVSAFFALLASASCNGESGTCATYACINTATFEDSMTIPKGTQQVDVRFCFEGSCDEGIIDLAAPDASVPCARWVPAARPSFGPGTQVCTSRSDDAGTVAVSAIWDDVQKSSVPPEGSKYQLRISEHGSGSVFLDEALSGSYRVTREDICHVCWEGTLKH